VGDLVWAYDHGQLRWVEREVVKVFRPGHRGRMATLRVQGETIRATGGHPFWVVRGEGLADRPKPGEILACVAGGLLPGRWVLARDLRAGDEVLLQHGEIVALESVRVDVVEEQVYNFHVAELQNYAVGACGVLVHNINTGEGKVKLDLMGGTESKLGPEWTNYDIAATEGIADDVANLSKHFQPGELTEVVANNPRAHFLDHLGPLMEEGGTVTVRGTMTNKFFRKIWDGKAAGFDAFEVVSTTEDVPNLGYRQTGGVRPVQGQINEIVLRKK
jgi:hypothetical protein